MKSSRKVSAKNGRGSLNGGDKPVVEISFRTEEVNARFLSPSDVEGVCRRTSARNPHHSVVLMDPFNDGKPVAFCIGSGDYREERMASIAILRKKHPDVPLYHKGGPLKVS